MRISLLIKSSNRTDANTTNQLKGIKMNDLTLYECDELIKIIETKAEMNDGELSEEDMQSIVEAQTTSIQKLNGLINYVMYLDGFSELAKKEITRIQERKKTAENRVDSIKRYLLPYVLKNGKKTVGTHTISTRKSKGVVLADEFNNIQYGEIVETFKPDKKKIKESIENGIEVQGAVLEERVNVSIR